MSRTTKILLIVGGIAAAGCCALLAATLYFGMQVAQNGDESPEAVLATASQIADITLPEGLEPGFSFGLLGMSMAIFSTTDLQTSGPPEMMIALVEVPSGDATAAEAMREQAASQMGGSLRNGREVSRTPVEIRGQAATLTITEGEGAGGVAMRQGFALFESKRGRPAMVIANGRSDTWDQAMLEAFLTSMK